MKKVALFAALYLAPCACVPQDKYDKLAVAAAQAQVDADRKQKAGEEEIARLNASLKDAEAQSQDRDSQIADLSTQRHNIQAALDESTAMNLELRGELERLGKDADKLLHEKGTLAKALDDAKSRLEELRKAQAAAEARTQLFQSFLHKFRPMIDAGQVVVATRDGRIVLTVPGDLVFDPGHVEIRAAGKGAVMELAKALADLNPRRFQVAVHTDNAKLKGSRYPTSWDLSVARATELVKYLVSLGVHPEALSAAGYGEWDPVASNDTAEGRTKNRRIELTLRPSSDEIVPITTGNPAK